MNLYPLTDEEIKIINELRTKKAKEKEESANREQLINIIYDSLKLFKENGGKVRFQGGKYIPIWTNAKFIFNNDEITITM